MDLLPAAPATIPAAFATEDRIAIRDLARDFAMREVLPLANELDPSTARSPTS